MNCLCGRQNSVTRTQAEWVFAAVAGYFLSMEVLSFGSFVLPVGSSPVLAAGNPDAHS